jgi:hypothetical protein
MSEMTKTNQKLLKHLKEKKEFKTAKMHLSFRPTKIVFQYGVDHQMKIKRTCLQNSCKKYKITFNHEKTKYRRTSKAFAGLIETFFSSRGLRVEIRKGFLRIHNKDKVNEIIINNLNFVEIYTDEDKNYDFIVYQIYDNLSAFDFKTIEKIYDFPNCRDYKESMMKYRNFKDETKEIEEIIKLMQQKLEKATNHFDLNFRLNLDACN